eukprot:TRINITY_DN2299_c0_g1_i6.p1 TRINITY_DN2299_c0_g1~~TRINITY_DN2299_c0_g1_i6.p1  ORF type:complete len:3028 (+),score=822.70 TRINITY_DN2299_c0_g1_i6:117-9200(+)
MKSHFFCFDLLPAIGSFVEQCRGIDLSRQLGAINKIYGESKSVSDYTPSDKKKILKELIRLASTIEISTKTSGSAPDVALIVARTFRPILPHLISELPSLIDNNAANSEKFFADFLAVSVSFSKLLPLCPHSLRFVLQFYKNSTPLFSMLDTLYYNSQIKNDERLVSLLKASYRFLKFFPTEFRSLWNWSPIFSFADHPNPEVRWYTLQCVSIYLGISDATKTKLLNNVENSLSMSTVDEESDSLENLLIYLHRNDAVPAEPHNMCVTAADLNQHIVDVCGILLSKTSTETPKAASCFIYTKTSQSNMKTLALAVSRGMPILLEGVTGAGKTALIDELALRLGNSETLIKIHLGDQADAKVLLGTYVCTEVPGEFRWQPGALTQAVTDGKWIVIEDIDLASMDVLSVLIPLLETRQLFIPGRGEVIKAADSFQLFATQTTGTGSRSNHSPILRNLWTKLVVEPLSSDELIQVLKELFPEMANIAKTFLHTFHLLLRNKGLSDEGKEEDLAVAAGRFLSSRDLLKWCGRVYSLHRAALNSDAAIRESVFLEAIDCFSGMVAKPALRRKLYNLVGMSWSISPERINYYYTNHKPFTQLTKSTFTVGRVTLSRNTSEKAPQSSFAFTKLSLRLMEKVAVCVQQSEPVLLVGDTGAGKTTSLQYIANQLGQTLVVLNLNQQSEAVDLIGGFKPVELRNLMIPLKNKFEKLFPKVFSRKKNANFFESVLKSFADSNWKTFISGLKSALKLVDKRLQEIDSKENGTTDKKFNPKVRTEWKALAASVAKFDLQKDRVKNNFAFEFVEGPLVSAVRNGNWVLLDEINLATTETLESLSGLLEGGSIILNDRGDIEAVPRHPNFRIFACMNPPNDVGKKDLPPGLRNRFTEFYVDELDEEEDLRTLVLAYLNDLGQKIPLDDIVAFYLEARKAASTTLSDGSNHKPHYSLRTLCRALEYTKLTCRTYSFLRALYEGFCMSFLTQLNGPSMLTMERLIKKHLVKGGNEKAFQKLPTKPGDNYEAFESFWIETGEISPVTPQHYILTESVRRQLSNLARIVVAKRYPILLQGPTSSGKTSMIEYLAQKTGHRFVRINNHDHTDLQEYLGSYISNSEGKLVFQEGILVEAVKKGYWIVLDELNLAPSEVLEALNRLLDDNRELFIPETQEFVTPHPNFALFATQNPPGLYGGRKMLSKAFRNRFLELHFDDIPENELETILEQRCSLPKSFSSKLVLIMKDLQRNRQSSQVFAGKHGFITLRDLFRWANRQPASYMELAQTGYMLLAERLRNDEERKLIKQILEKHLNVVLNVDQLYDCEKTETFVRLNAKMQTSADHNIVWTTSMKRLFTLVGECLKFKEPVLLVGETGTGKTTICQLYSTLDDKRLHILNCHQNTETADFVGGLRPVRGKQSILVDLMAMLTQFNKSNLVKKKLDVSQSVHDIMTTFEKISKDLEDDISLSSDIDAIRQQYQKYRSLFVWHDGPLVQSMKVGDMFLIDEISLADDAILERLNSVLEPGRLLVLAEKGSEEIEELVGHSEFRILATMNPGGDFGKKELSPALRNRFTEIWVPSISGTEELAQIIEKQFTSPKLSGFSKHILDFTQWFTEKQKSRAVLSIRDVLTWCNFMNIGVDSLDLDAYQSFIHGAFMVILDGLGIGSGLSLSIRTLREECYRHLLEQVPAESREAVVSATPAFVGTEKSFGVSPFFVQKGAHASSRPLSYALSAPTTSSNTVRVLRAMQLRKPILLEGSAGVGKTSLITALAAASNHRLVRINLSEQTDLMDLLGSDLPVHGGKAGEFAWCDGVFLRALKAGDWILLDELNLAPQSILEGLNSCLDHRAAVYIPELDQTFDCPSSFRIFACQNPAQQGGGRKGLPKSFLNRFTKVYLDPLEGSDLFFISSTMFPDIDANILKNMIEFNTQLHHDVMVACKFGRRGSPWEFNLRDVFRWCDLLKAHPYSTAEDYVDLLYLQRMRTTEDRVHIRALFNRVFGHPLRVETNPYYHVTPTYLQVGKAIVKRSQLAYDDVSSQRNGIQLLHRFLNPLENVINCVNMNWMCIITGPTASGKTSIIRLLAQLTRNTLLEFAMNTGVDTTELLGGFEQVDVNRYKKSVLEMTEDMVGRVSEELLVLNRIDHLKELRDMWSLCSNRLRRKNDQLLEVFDHEEYQLLRQLVESVQRFLPDFDFVACGLRTPTNLLQTIQQLQSVDLQSVVGCFEWIDGMLIRALEEGHWILLDNVNFCNPSVLDRLNPLLETNGYLLVNERGMIDGEIKLIRPHPNFRIFLAMDPSKNGEISRPMRNRGIEIALMDPKIQSDDSVTLLCNLGLPSALASACVDFHCLIEKKLSTSEAAFNLRHLIEWGHLIVEQLQRAIPLSQATIQAIDQIYIRGRSKESAIIREEYAKHHLATLAMSWDQNVPEFQRDFNYLSNSRDSTIRRQGAVLKNAAQQLTAQNLSDQASKSWASFRAQMVASPRLALNFPLRVLDSLFKFSELPPSEYLAALSSLDTQKLGNVILYAGWFMVESSSMDDFQRRREWIAANISSPQQLDQIFSAVFESSQLLKLAQESLETLSADWTTEEKEFLHYQPLDVPTSGYLRARLLEPASPSQPKEAVYHLNILNRIKLQIRRMSRFEVEKKVYDVADRTETPTLIQQSYVFNQYRTGRLDNDAVVVCYPLLHQLDTLIHLWLVNPNRAALVDVKKLTEVTNVRDFFWDSLNKNEFNVEHFVVLFHRLLKTVKSFSNTTTMENSSEFRLATESLSSLIQRVETWLKQKGYDMPKNGLWKHGTKVEVFTDANLHSLNDKMAQTAVELNSFLDATKTSYLGVDAKHSAIHLDTEVKRDLIEAMATLYWLNSHSEKNQQLSKDLIAHLKTLSETVAARPKRENYLEMLSNNTGSEMNEDSLLLHRIKNTEAGLIPLCDYWSVMEEGKIISELALLQQPKYFDSKTSLLNKDGFALLKKMEERLIQFIEHGITRTSRPIHDFVHHQRIKWISQAYSPLEVEGAQTTDAQELNLSSLLQEILSSWHERLWNYSFNLPF